MNVNVGNFLEWFFQQFVNIGTQIINILDGIIIYGNVSLLHLIITLTIIQMFLSLILTIPQNAMHKVEKIVKERKKKEKNEEETRTNN